jgi:hypothetical protein
MQCSPLGEPPSKENIGFPQVSSRTLQLVPGFAGPNQSQIFPPHSECSNERLSWTGHEQHSNELLSLPGFTFQDRNSIHVEYSVCGSRLTSARGEIDLQLPNRPRSLSWTFCSAMSRLLLMLIALVAVQRLFITAARITKLCARGRGGLWRTCAIGHDEPRIVWTSRTTSSTMH